MKSIFVFYLVIANAKKDIAMLTIREIDSFAIYSDKAFCAYRVMRFPVSDTIGMPNGPHESRRFRKSLSYAFLHIRDLR